MKKLYCSLLVLLLSMQSAFTAEIKRTDWWTDARFGMFIHWGLYSVAAGEWNGKQIDGIGEWIQNFAKVPNSEYEKLADNFTLSNYKPDIWAKMAKDAGAKYVVFTSKHHDGFCLYPSEVSDFDIERTPYKGDPMKELIEACRKQGLKIGIYYSHRQDWREEDAAVMQNEYDGHYGKPKSEIKPDLDRYINGKALPQMKEILTRYGKIDLLWYDTPFDLSKEQSQVFVDVVRDLQPDCIINGRVGYNLGDYGPLGDNEMPCANATTELEMVATMNHTWGYKKQDNDWKTPKDILSSLIESVSRSINYMINIGPKEDGVVPAPSVEILSFIGDWMKVNSESIYGASGNPFNDNYPWGYITSKENDLYLHLMREPKDCKIELRGLRSPIGKATIISSGKKLKTSFADYATIEVPGGLDYDKIPVIRLSSKKKFIIDNSNFINEDVISLPASSGKVIPGKAGMISFAEGGNTENFNPQTGALDLECVVDVPGVYDINLVMSRHWRRSFAKGTYVTLTVDGQKFDSCLLEEDGMIKNVRSNSYPETWSKVASVEFKDKGVKRITLSVDKIGTYSRLGFFGEDLQGESDNNIRVMRLELIRK